MTEPWEQRFRAPTLTLPTWAIHAPNRLVLSSNESGAWQVYAWDRAAGTRRRVTDHPIGVASGVPTPDGEGVVWFHDVTGDEVGHWLYEPFVGVDGEDVAADGGNGRRPFAPGVPDAWSAGLAVGDGVVVVGTAGADGFAVHVIDGFPVHVIDGFAVHGAEVGDTAAKVVHRHPEMVEVAGLSRDSRLLCLEHAEHGDSIHPALRVVTAVDGEVVADQWDGPGLGLQAAGWAPFPGDHRMAIVHERDGRERPGVWDASTGQRRDFELDLPGDVGVTAWCPDETSLLVVHEHEGRSQLFRLDLLSGDLTGIPHPPGTIWGAAVRPDGEVWFRLASGAAPPTVRTVEGEIVCAPEGDPAPRGRPYRSWSFANPSGQRVHGFLATPPGEGPHPVLMFVHGGPTSAYTDTFMPDVQAWVDHGLAVAMVNYRGSTGYGTAFRDALIGNPGFPEVEDVVAGLDSLVAEGVADPGRAAVTGGSWGGYVTLLALGLHPERWSAAVAVVPVADYPTAYRDEAPGLQAFDRTLFGGSPDDLPDLYEERSPLTYVERVRAPVLVIAGDHDSRCPLRQVLNYVEALEARGGEVELYRFDAGHGSMVIDERVRQMQAELDFVVPRVAPGP